MRLFVSLLILSALFLTSCANRGVIVRKDSRPAPFYESFGIEGMYSFTLRDETGALHRQMVTPEVYERYALGDQFDDQAPTAATNDVAEPKTMQIAMHRPTFAVGRLAKTKTVTTQRIASVKPRPATKSKLAQKSTRHATQRIATRRTQSKISHTQVASRSRTRAKLAQAGAKKSKHVAVSTAKAPKPWKLTAPTVESAAAAEPAPPSEGPAAKIEAPIPRPTPRETQVEIPNEP